MRVCFPSPMREVSNDESRHSTHKRTPGQSSAMTRMLKWGWGLVLLSALLLSAAAAPSGNGGLHTKVAEEVLPAQGHHSKIVLGESIIRLVQTGVLEPRKLAAVYAQRGGIPAELGDLSSKPSNKPIILTRENAGIYVNLLWPLGLANRLAANDASLLNGPSRFRLASTGGWNLGKENNGGVYFNKFHIVGLTAPQEALVAKVARNTFRPCCDNSTFFQDCNHGSALLGLLTLGAAQGLSEDELYREALAYNSFWFPHNYVHAALYFKAVRGTEWQMVDPREVMSANFSSASGWQANVAGELKRRRLLPPQSDTDCSI